MNTSLRPLGAELIRSSDADTLRAIAHKYFPIGCGPSHSNIALPKGARDYLWRDNPRLIELCRRYQAVQCPAAIHSVWRSGVLDTVDLCFFRGDNAYVYQFQDGNSELTHALTAYHLRSLDNSGLLSRLTEDGLFGVHTFNVDDELLVSRDLLDSVNELLFLRQHFDLDKTTVLDIGAGYGRFAHRMTTGFAGRVFCTDAVAESTFLSEYYLAFRKADRTSVISLDEIASELPSLGCDLAINIHSFTECPFAAVEWWIGLLRDAQVKHLFIVPNQGDHGGTKLLARESDESKRDIEPLIHSAGYRLVHKRPKYAVSSVQKFGVSPTWYYLFSL